jgi:ABC-type amino acid transport substrate-binding protein
MLKRLILATGLTVAMLSSAALADGHSIKIATEGTYAPWSFLSPDGKLQGYDIDATMAVCEKAGLECELFEQDWEGIIPSIQAKKYDVIASSMAITKQRLEVINFTSPYAISTR